MVARTKKRVGRRDLPTSAWYCPQLTGPLLVVQGL